MEAFGDDFEENKKNEVVGIPSSPEQQVTQTDQEELDHLKKEVVQADQDRHHDQEDNNDDTNEEGYDSDEDDEVINDARLLASMLRESENHEPPTSNNLTIQQLMQENNVVIPQNAMQIEAADEKHCWVCFASEEDDPTAIWAHPCRCRGTTKWVHQACIQRWVDEKQKGNTKAGVECPQCGTSYVIRFPQPTFFVAFLDSGDLLVQRLCPIITGGVCVGSIYWTCVTFGAVTLMQTVGHDRSLVLMERADPMLLLVSLPLVPVGLIIGQMIRWEEAVLHFLRMAVPKTPLVRSLMPTFAYQPERRAIQSSIPPMTDAISVTRIFCGAIFFPSIATFLGATLFKNVPSQIKRTLFGGLTFAVVKGILKIYHKQHTYVRQCQKQILDFNE